MKYCVMHSLRFETPAKRDGLDQAVRNEVAGKPIWGRMAMSSGQDEDGFPLHNLEIRFENIADMEDLFTFLKGKIENIPVLKGTVSKHYCSHDEGTPQPCQITEEISK
ncbi:hypothetical protein ES703_55976 [subsurface metagenome]